MDEPQPQIIETCNSCGQLLDVSDLAPFSEIDCPHCGTAQRVRTKFHHFELAELLGEGGMGSVFRASDQNLQRQVALKILKKGAASSNIDYKKLEEEARITASINHPHVVKVFSFGEDNGLFYLAMELVPKGSLDDLMGLQGRVGELQALNVGIQVAQGLQAALDRNLLHRDVKPGNILFADASTAKIVDFGLALILDEHAQEQGEIWGTPYYIAPEKLDNRPEDFRSDMYSLGGTLFHAIAGRPPFEASTASMVALKHIKSQAVSLQAFAPEVSSETAYVVNRMLHKDPDGRYASYDELIGHLNYAKQKLQERAQAPVQRKERSIVESADSRKVMGIIWGVTLLALVTAAILAFVYRDAIFPDLESSDRRTSVTKLNPRQLDNILNSARQAFAAGRFQDAITDFDAVASNTSTQPTRNWALANKGFAYLMDSNSPESVSTFETLSAGGLYSTSARDQRLANFFLELSKLMIAAEPISAGTIRIYNNDNYDTFAMLAYGMKNWNMGAIDDAGEILEAFDESDAQAPYDWINSYKGLVQPYLVDFKNFRRLSRRAEAVTPAQRAPLIAEIQKARAEATTGSRIDEAFAALEAKVEGGAE